MLANVLIKSLKNLLLPSIWKLFLICMVFYFVSFVGIALGATYVITHMVTLTSAEGSWMHVIGSIGGWLIAWMLFPLLYPILISFFDDKIAENIEREDYPLLAPAEPPFWPTFGNDLAFSLKAVLFNIICLPLYFIPLAGIIIYYSLNGYLLGMQFFRMAAGRRVDDATSKKLQKRAKNSIFMIGVAISLCATIPLLNLAAPVLGVACMLHLFHSLHGANKQFLLD